MNNIKNKWLSQAHSAICRIHKSYYPSNEQKNQWIHDAISFGIECSTRNYDWNFPYLFSDDQIYIWEAMKNYNEKY